MEMVRAAADPNVPELLSSNVIEMIMEVIKRTGKEFTEDDVEVIADASKQTGENLGKVKAKDFYLGVTKFCIVRTAFSISVLSCSPFN